MGYLTSAQVLNASGFSVPQLRPRFAIVALQPQIFRHFRWPVPTNSAATVGETLGDLMSEGGWPGAKSWANRADQVAPTLVGGSKKHGGPDLGPTRARAQWRTLGVDGLGIANEPPGPDCPVDFMPKLTLRMTARLQGFPDGWLFAGGKTSAYRQIGNAFPPPVARAIGEAILAALGQAPSTSIRGQSVMFEASTRTILAADQS